MLSILEILGYIAVTVGMITMMVMTWVLVGRFLWQIVQTIRGKSNI